MNWVGIDGYYLKRSWTFASLFGPTIKAVRVLTLDRILISETSATPAAGKAAKIADLFAGVRAYGLLGFVWFDAKKRQDWSLSTPDAFAAFRRGAGHDGDRLGRAPQARLAAAGGGRLPVPRGLGIMGGWPLLVILAVQAALSLRLVSADTAFQDEAAYLWAGHLEWSHWLHGAAIPPFAPFFSGAPVIYPAVGALADSVGGLAGARILSLAFMLMATALLWGTARRLCGRRAAFFAAALFAVLGPALHLGEFAAYDALSVFLVALAAWCVVRAGGPGEGTREGEGGGEERGPGGGSGGRQASGPAGRGGDRLDGAGGAALAVGNAAAYASALFDPVVVVLALLIALPSGARLAARRCSILVLVGVALLTAGVLTGGSSYRTGIEQTTLARVAGGDSALSVLTAAWSWTGLVVLLALCGVIISWSGRPGWLRTALLAVLTVAGLLGPLEQAHLQTLASLNKHVGLGAWFAAVAAGYAVDRVIAAAPAGRTRAIAGGACVVALAFPLVLGASQSRLFSTDWPNATSFLAIFRPLADRGGGRLLVEDASIARYYLPAGSQWQRWSTTRNIVLPSGASTGGPASTLGRHRGRQRRRLRRVHHARLLLLRRAELRRHHRPGPPDQRRPAAQPPLPHHRRRPLRHRDPADRPGHLCHLAIRAAAVTTTEPASLAARESTARAAGPAPSRPAVTLPPPPDDNEKYAYTGRNLPYLAVTLVISASLPDHQPDPVRDARSRAVAVPGLHRHVRRLPGDQPAGELHRPGFRPGRAPGAHPGLAAGPLPQRQHLPAGLRRADRPAPQHLARGVRADRELPGAGAGARPRRRPQRGGRSWSQAYGFCYVRRPDLRACKKSGNLRYAFARTTGEYVVIFDADFAPRTDFLAETLPYMDDPAIGIVQTPQFFRESAAADLDRDFSGAIQEVFYRSIQVARDRFGAAICVGTSAVYRRAALEPQGGPTLIPYAEDVHTGLDVARRLVPGLRAGGALRRRLPGQPRRIRAPAVPVVRGKRRRGVLPPAVGVRMPVPARLTYISGFFYYASRACSCSSARSSPSSCWHFCPARSGCGILSCLARPWSPGLSFTRCGTDQDTGGRYGRWGSPGAGRMSSRSGTAPGAGRWAGTRPGPRAARCGGSGYASLAGAAALPWCGWSWRSGER